MKMSSHTYPDTSPRISHLFDQVTKCSLTKWPKTELQAELWQARYLCLEWKSHCIILIWHSLLVHQYLMQEYCCNCQTRSVPSLGLTFGYRLLLSNLLLQGDVVVSLNTLCGIIYFMWVGVFVLFWFFNSPGGL